MISAYEIREQIARYLAGQTALDQFEDWLVSKSWNMHQDSDGQSQKLASAIELRLAELSSAHFSEAAFRMELVPYVTKYFAKQFVLSNQMFSYRQDQPVFGASNDVIKTVAAFQVAYRASSPGVQPLVGTESSVVYG